MNNSDPGRKIADSDSVHEKLCQISPTPGKCSGVSFDDVVGAAERSLAEIADEFASGEVPPEAMARLTQAVAEFDRLARAGLVEPERLQTAASRLSAGIADVTSCGSAWLEATRPAAEAQKHREHVRQAYLPRGL